MIKRQSVSWCHICAAYKTGNLNYNINESLNPCNEQSRLFEFLKGIS